MSRLENVYVILFSLIFFFQNHQTHFVYYSMYTYSKFASESEVVDVFSRNVNSIDHLIPNINTRPRSNLHKALIASWKRANNIT